MFDLYLLNRELITLPSNVEMYIALNAFVAMNNINNDYYNK